MNLDPSYLGCKSIGWFLKLFYNFKVEGEENMPADGPYIVLMLESSFLTIICDSAASATLMLKPYQQKKMMTFMGEEFWNYRLTRMFTKVINGFPLMPHGAGMYGLNMLRALDHVKRGGVVSMNPEGDMGREGRPLPLRDGAAWLALHSAAPIVPLIVDIGVYDIWPTWQSGPHRRGSLIQRVGKPFRVTDRPLEAITPEDMRRANAKIREELDALCYGPGGVAGWIGKPAGPGRLPEMDETPGSPLPLRSLASGANANGKPTPLAKRGLAQLLWRCPVCGADDALEHRRPRLRASTLHCLACGTAWQMRRVPGKDYRLIVTAGDKQLVGLDMSLCDWYDELRKRFRLRPAALDGLVTQPGEEVYLRVDGIKMQVDGSSSLLRPEWQGTEPPARELAKTAGEWRHLGPGTLWLTSRRLHWEGPPSHLDFFWSKVTAVSLRMYSLFGVNYGSSVYRFLFSYDNGLKWLTYSGEVGGKVARDDGHKMTVSPY
jgi:1-acyl-sn-glycerol-3-phosphate acyltransferase